MTGDVEALSTLYLAAIGPDTPRWMVEQRLGRLAAAVHGATMVDVGRCYELALRAVEDAELVAKAFDTIRPRAPQLSPPAAPDAPELSPLSQRILKRLSPAAAISRRDLHRSVQRHVAGATELDEALAELAAQGRVRLVGSGSRVAIELLPA